MKRPRSTGPFHCPNRLPARARASPHSMHPPVPSSNPPRIGDPMLVTLGILAVLGLITFVKSVKIIGQAEVMVIERLGRFHRVARSGFNLLIPYVERPRSIEVRYVVADISGATKVPAGSRTRIALRSPV